MICDNILVGSDNMIGYGTQEIETERLILRKLDINDVNYAYRNWTSDQKVCKFLRWNIHKDELETEKYFREKISKYNNPYKFDFIVILKENNQPIGEIEAVRVSLIDDLVEVGYCYGSRYWNNGYATEALIAFVSYMFNEVKIGKVLASHMSCNSASGKVMQKAGMHYDATLKGYVVNKVTNQRSDVICYSIDKDNYYNNLEDKCERLN